MNTSMPPAALNDGHRLERIGLGVYQLSADSGECTIRGALDIGYRRIDTAAMYGNEEMVGRAIAMSSVPREEIAVTTKIWNDGHGFNEALRAFEASRKRLGVDYVDVLLIHWPCPQRNAYVNTWRALIALQSAGSVRTIGVSNFMPEHLDRLIGETGVVPAINQIELHPRFQQPDVRAYHVEHDIVTEAWSPLGRGSALENPALGAIASRLGRTVAQVVIRWHIQIGNLVVPKSSNLERLRQNLYVDDFELRPADLEAIARCDRGERSGPHPLSVG